MSVCVAKLLHTQSKLGLEKAWRARDRAWQVALVAVCLCELSWANHPFGYLYRQCGTQLEGIMYFLLPPLRRTAPTSFLLK